MGMALFTTALIGDVEGEGPSEVPSQIYPTVVVIVADGTI
jgi:hypothetical protein